MSGVPRRVSEEMTGRRLRAHFHKTSVFSRRQCLREVLGAAAIASGACILAGDGFSEEKGKNSLPSTASDHPQIRLGFGTYGMKSLAAVDSVKHCAAIGYDGLELCLIDGWPTSLDQLAKNGLKELHRALLDSGLFVPSLLESLPCLRGKAAHQNNLNRMKTAVEFARDLKQEYPPVVQSIVGGRSSDWGMHKNQLVAELSDWAEIGQQMGVTICFKPHASHLVSRPDQALWVLEQVGNSSLQLVYDYSHFYLEGLQLESTLEAMLPNAPYVQIKDSRRNEGGGYQYLLPGDGMTDYQAMFRKLIESGYRGFVNVEVSSMIHRQKDYEPIATAQRCYDRLRPILSRSLNAL